VQLLRLGEQLNHLYQAKETAELVATNLGRRATQQRWCVGLRPCGD